MNPREVPPIALVARAIKHQVEATGALERCLKAAGYKVRATYDRTAPESIVICWSWGKAAEQRAKDPSKIILCMDHGYTWKRKTGLVNTGWSSPDQPFGLNGYGEHAVVDDGGARSRAKGWWDELYPIRDKLPKVALLLGQVMGDAMIREVPVDYATWLRARHDELGEAGWEVRFRPHPVMVNRGTVAEYGNVGSPSPYPQLWDDLMHAGLAVGLNSNALVAAYTFGLPTRVYNEGSMLWPLVTAPGADVPWEKREQWWARMAYCQWTYEELENGTWLEYHRPIMHRLVEGLSSRPWHSTVL